MGLERIVIPTIVVLLLIGGGIIIKGTTAESTLSTPVHKWGDDGLFVKVCCIDDIYFFYGNYLTIPIEVEVWDQNLNPISRANVHLVVSGDTISGQHVEVLNNTKTTNNNGIAKFGISLAHDSFFSTRLLIAADVNYKQRSINKNQYYDKEITIVPD